MLFGGFHQCFQLGGRGLLAIHLDAKLRQAVLVGEIGQRRMINDEGATLLVGQELPDRITRLLDLLRQLLVVGLIKALIVWIKLDNRVKDISRDDFGALYGTPDMWIGPLMIVMLLMAFALMMVCLFRIFFVQLGLLDAF